MSLLGGGPRRPLVAAIIGLCVAVGTVAFVCYLADYPPNFWDVP
jgi:hypothetical protein